MGIVVRDSNGRVAAARIISRCGWLDPTSGEALASYHTTSLCKELGLSQVIMEGDAQVVGEDTGTPTNVYVGQ